MSALWDLASPVFGGVIAFVLQHYWHEFNSGDDRRKRRRENLEKLATLAFEHLLFLRAEALRVANGKEHELRDTFLDFRVIQELYFEDLEKYTSEMRKLRTINEKKMTELYRKRKAIGGKKIGITQWMDEIYAEGAKMRGELIITCRTLIEQDEAWLANAWRRRIDWLVNYPPRLSKPAE
jgi:hypothetical protein